MGHRKKKSQTVHTSPLRPSKRDEVELAVAVWERFLIVTERYFRVYGVPCIPPSELNSDMLLWRTFCLRIRAGDLRNTDDEWNATTRIADWTLRMNEICTGQKLTKADWVKP